MEENPCERQLVATVLLCPDRTDEVTRLLAVAAIGDPRSRIIFRALLDLRGQGLEPTADELGDYLESRGELETAGGWSYIVGIDLELPDLERLPEIAEGMRRKADSDGAHAYHCHVCGCPASVWSEPLAVAGHPHPTRWPACGEHR